MSWCNRKHSPCNAGACAVNVMSCCMQPDGRNVSKASGVKTPKHPLHRCLDFSMMKPGDGQMVGWANGSAGLGSDVISFPLRGPQTDRRGRKLGRPSGANTATMWAFLHLLWSSLSSPCFPFRVGCFSFLKDKIFGLWG